MIEAAGSHHSLRPLRLRLLHAKNNKGVLL